MVVLNGYVVLVKEEDVKETQTKGLLVPDIIKNRINIAKVHSKSSEIKNISVGDIVVFDDSEKDKIVKFMFEQKEYFAIQSNKIIAVLNRE